MTIGVDRYQRSSKLKNAVSDAAGALEAFTALGFQPRAQLFDENATGEALQRLVSHDLRALPAEDSLVVFFAGHGFTDTRKFDDGTCIQVGYIVPVDGDPKQPGTCLRLRTWLDELAHLSVRHILVILDSCRSGIALEPMQRWHNAAPGSMLSTPLERLQERRSRRIITSALGNQLASDRGPKDGHSLFTGFLIDALAGEAGMGGPYTTGTMVGAFVQQRVIAYPRANQTPDFGVLQLDDHGELVMPFRGAGEPNPPLPEPPKPVPPELDRLHSRDRPPLAPGHASGGRVRAEEKAPAKPIPDPALRPGMKPSHIPYAPARSAFAAPVRDPFRAPARPPRARDPRGATSRDVFTSDTRDPFAEDTRDPSGGELRDPLQDESRAPAAIVPLTFLAPPVPQSPGVRSGWVTEELRPGAGRLDFELASELQRHAEQRAKHGMVISLIAGEPRHALTSVATWAAQRGELTLATQASRLDEVVREVIAHVPWFRCLPAARVRFAKAARLELRAVDAALDARNGRERTTWIDDVAAASASGRDAIRVAGWLLASLRDPRDALDETTSPVRGRELLTALGELAAPLAVCLYQEEPAEAWLRGAIAAAAELAAVLPWNTVSVIAPRPLAEGLLAKRGATEAISLARQGLVVLDPPRPGSRPAAGKPLPGTDAAALEEKLWAALQRHPGTRDRFERRVAAPIHEEERQVEVLLVERKARLVVELDGWYHLGDPLAYSRARLKDTWLRRAGFFPLRFLAEDVERRLDKVIEEIASGRAGRRIT